MPSVSANCMATLVRVPPMSVEPSIRLTVPSGLTLAAALDFKPMLNQKPLAMPRPRYLPFERRLPMVAGLGGFQRFDEADPRIGRPIDAARPLLGRVLQPELDRVDLQLLGQLVDHRLAGERRLRGAGRPIGLRLGLVDQHVVAVDPGVGQLVAAEHAHAARADHAAGKRPGVVGQPGLARGQLAVLGRAQLDPHERAGRGSGPLENFVAVHHHLHRPAALAAEHRGHRLQIDGDLAAEAAADFARHHRDLRHGNLQQLGRLLPGRERPLRRSPDRQMAVLVPQRGRDVRLDVALVHAGRFELALDDHVRPWRTPRRRCPSRSGCAWRCCWACRPFLPIELVCTSSCSSGASSRIASSTQVTARQRLVFDLDQLDGFLGHVRIDGRHRRDGVSLVERLVVGQAIGAQVGQVNRALAQVGDLVLQIRKIGRRDHRTHAGQLFSRRSVDTLDPRVGVRAAQDLAVHRAVQLHVRSVNRPPGHLVRSVVPNRPRADDLVLVLLFASRRGHLCKFLSPSLAGRGSG